MTVGLRAPIQRLSSHDALFLHWEHPWQPMHVGETLVYDGEFTADDMVAMLEARMASLPRYRQRVVFPPFGISHPTWEDDPDFDVRNHVDERWLPPEAGDADLSTFLGTIFMELIDRSHPLWHMTIVHGHDSGNTIAFLKLHHSMVDGVSSIEVIEVLHSPAPPASSDVTEALPPRSRGVLLREAVADELDRGLEAVGIAVKLLREGRVSELVQRGGVIGRTLRDIAPMLVSRPPGTPFNAPITPRREVAWLNLPMEEVHQVRRKLGATVNDLVLTVLAGALGAQMERGGFATDGEPLRCMVPWSVRQASQAGSLGNAVSMVVAPLFVDEDDPRDRLTAQQTAMADLRGKEQAVGIHELIAVGEWVPAPLYALIWKHWPRRYFPFNFVSSNVRGPAEPLFLDE
ncbi:MAG: Diacylglycerol O-acyltransferase, partial [Marmoricola sp.]|nr:Diacylglycerol O-acyltransferase [Marmoricola sp.]